MAAPKKYGDDVREAVNDLCNVQGLSAAKARPILAAQFDPCPPENTILEIARKARAERQEPLGSRPLPQALDILARQAFEIVNEEFSALRAKKGAVDADHLLKLARTLKELQPLAQAKPADGKQDQPTEPKGLLGQLTAAPNGETPSQSPAVRFAHA